MGIKAILPLVLLFGVPNQHGPVPISVHSVEQSPVTLSGTVADAQSAEQRFQYSYKVDLTFANASATPVLLLVAALVVNQAGTGERSLSSVEEFFFSENALQPGATLSRTHFLAPFSASQPRADEGALGLTAEGSVVFIQFADGSYWGDAKAAEETLRQRQLAMAMLTFLTETYRTRGESEFIAELMRPSQVDVVSGLQYLYKNSGEVSRVILRMTRMLEHAGGRRDALHLVHSSKDGILP